MSELITLRDLPGVASISGWCHQPDRWQYPTVIDTMAALDEVSIGLFSITRDDTRSEEGMEFTADEGEEPFTAEEYEERFNATRAPWPEARQFYEAIGWDLSDGHDGELICAHWFARQIIAATLGLVEGARLTPDGSGKWSTHDDDDETATDDDDMAKRLENEVAAFLAKRDRS
jgi:hypothetical protein